MVLGIVALVLEGLFMTSVIGLVLASVGYHEAKIKRDHVLNVFGLIFGVLGTISSLIALVGVIAPLFP